MKVKKRTLLLIACLVWGIAGFNILRIGILAYRPYISVLNIVLTCFCNISNVYFRTSGQKTYAKNP